MARKKKKAVVTTRDALKRFGPRHRALGRVPVHDSPELVDLEAQRLLSMRGDRETKSFRKEVVAIWTTNRGDLPAAIEAIEHWLLGADQKSATVHRKVVAHEVEEGLLSRLWSLSDPAGFRRRSDDYVVTVTAGRIGRLFRRHYNGPDDIRPGDALKELAAEWKHLGPVVDSFVRDVQSSIISGEVAGAIAHVESWLHRMPARFGKLDPQTGLATAGRDARNPEHQLADEVDGVLLPVLRLLQDPAHALPADRGYVSQILVHAPPLRSGYPKGFTLRCACGGINDEGHADDCWIAAERDRQLQAYREQLPRALRRAFVALGKWALIHDGTAAAFAFADVETRCAIVADFLSADSQFDPRPVGKLRGRGNAPDSKHKQRSKERRKVKAQLRQAIVGLASNALRQHGRSVSEPEINRWLRLQSAAELGRTLGPTVNMTPGAVAKRICRMREAKTRGTLQG